MPDGLLDAVGIVVSLKTPEVVMRPI